MTRRTSPPRRKSPSASPRATALPPVGSVAALAFLALASAAPAGPDWAREVRPVLSEKCYQCHGPDEATRKADLRFDLLDEAIESGVIEPGEPDASFLVERILSDDPKIVMPPPESKKELTERERTILVEWIAAGAPHDDHWAFGPIRAPEVPEIPEAGEAVRGPIDAFVLARLRAEGVEPLPEADRETLLRRATLDLTGLPPTLAEMDAFLADESPGAWERAIDRLLASPAHAERMTLDWLDAARFADTFGYQNDREMQVWPWRDWAIRAFDANLPYDKFLTWQIAGDLLPNPTPDQRLATAFNRLHRQTNEGGSVEEEFRLEYVADRVETFATSILGLTFECARCHDHKFDPISAKDFWSLSAFFNSIDESGLYSHFTDTAPTPAMPLFPEGKEAELARLNESVRAAEEALAVAERAATPRFFAWLARTDRAVAPREPQARVSFDAAPEGGVSFSPDTLKVSGHAAVPGVSGEAATFDGDGAVSVSGGGAGDFDRFDAFSISMFVRAPEIAPRMVVAHRSEASLDAASRGYELVLDAGRPEFSLVHFWPGNAVRVRAVDPIPAGEWVHLAATHDGSGRAGGIALYVGGRRVATETIRDRLDRTIKYEGKTADFPVKLGARFRDPGLAGGAIDEFRIDAGALSAIEVALLAGAEPSGERDALRDHYVAAVDPVVAERRASLREARRAAAEAFDAVPQIMVMEELPAPRPARILARGDYRQPRDEVPRATPGFLPPMPAGAPLDRLGLARWLFDESNPLTARVAANRLWRIMFGRGIVATPEDFGVQGDPPSHPELLDWLATRYRELGWDTKAMLREIALSATYRRASDPRADLVARDPENALLARGPRHRLSAEEIRDAALAASGLLVAKIGGPSVKPYQPEGIWKDASGVEYVRGQGEDLHRRSMYTFVKRTVPPPSMLTFDSIDRETCVVRRERTRTPLQALVLLNDPQFAEAARVLAERTLARLPTDPGAAVEEIFRAATSRRPTPAQAEILRRAYEEQLAWFAARPEEAAAYVAAGEAPRAEGLPVAELAATTAIAQMAMNHDAFQTKR